MEAKRLAIPSRHDIEIERKLDWRMRKNSHAPSKSAKVPAFVTRAERAMRRAAHNVKIQNRALGLPVIVWQNGKVVEKPA